MSGDIAVLHGPFTSDGGAERVAVAVARAFDAPIYTPQVDPEIPPPDVVVRELDQTLTSRFLNWLHEPNVGRSVYWAFRHVYDAQRYTWIPRVRDYDTVIITKNTVGHYVPSDTQTVVQYYHSTPRREYDLYDSYGASAKNRFYSLFMRSIWETQKQYADAVLANSELVQRRLDRYWGLDSTVIHPPVDVASYDRPGIDADGSLYLTFSRLRRHKRMMEIVQAFRDHPDKHLIVGGKGPREDELREVAPENVTIAGYLSEARKRELLAEASALLYNPVNEDFGIVPIEAFAAGTPVIGTADGFTQYQVQDGINGLLYEGHEPAAISAAVERFASDGVAWSPGDIQAFAQQFDYQRFEDELHAAVKRAAERASVDAFSPELEARVANV